MKLRELMEKLGPLAEANPDIQVLVGREEAGWFDEITALEKCRINRQHDGLICAGDSPHPGDGGEEVLVLET